MSSEIAIRVQNLSKCYEIYETPRDRLKQFMLPKVKRAFGQEPCNYYREFWALRDVSFEVNRGETVGIIGRNGSGKSTLLQMICGTLTPTSGTVKTFGRVAALLELGAGFNPEFTGRENVLLNASILGFPQEEMLARMGEILAFSELGDFFDQPVKMYSSGMYARLAFSAAVNVEPLILIVDEALSVGDARFVAKCMRRIKEIKDNGATILFVSHDVGSVRTLCEHVVWLDKGCVVEQGDVFPVTGRYMEFMFKDKENASDLVCKEVIAIEEVVTEDSLSSDIICSTQTAVKKLDIRPVTHWGSHKGIIVSASVCDRQGNRRDVHQWGDPLEVLIEVNVPIEISREHLSVAFSIKDLKGTDLIVSTTHDLDCRRCPEETHFKVSFKLVNPLVTGQYLLVAAVENRQHHDIHYYEYVEGAHYFSSLSVKHFYGLFQPSITQSIKV